MTSRIWSRRCAGIDRDGGYGYSMSTTTTRVASICTCSSSENSQGSPFDETPLGWVLSQVCRVRSGDVSTRCGAHGPRRLSGCLRGLLECCCTQFRLRIFPAAETARGSTISMNRDALYRTIRLPKWSRTSSNVSSSPDSSTMTACTRSPQSEPGIPITAQARSPGAS